MTNAELQQIQLKEANDYQERMLLLGVKGHELACQRQGFIDGFMKFASLMSEPSEE